MIDLSNLSGLNIFFDDGKLILNDALQANCSIRIRHISDLADVWMNAGLKGDQIVYTTYMHLIRTEDEQLFDENQLEHGIVVMPPGIYSGEYAKLYGHFHPPLPDNPNTSSELHSILYGRGNFLLQESFPPYDHITDVVLIEARTGDKFIIPPNYGHIAINPSNDFLIYDGFLPSHLEANYEPYQRFRGGAYYDVTDKNNIPGYQLNPNYTHLPTLRRISAKDIKNMDIINSYTSCYEAVINHFEYFDFINKPQLFKNEWGF